MANHLFHWFGLCSSQSEALGFFQRLVETSDSLQYRILKWYYHRSIHFGWDATWGTAFWRRGESEGTGVRVTTGEGGGVGGGASSRGGGGTSRSRGGEAGAGGGLLGSSLLVFLVRKLIFLNTPRKDFFLVFSSSLAFKSTWTFWASNWLFSWKELESNKQELVKEETWVCFSNLCFWFARLVLKVKMVRRYLPW